MELAKLECSSCNGVLEYKQPEDWHWKLGYCPFCASDEVEVLEPLQLEDYED